MRRQAFVFLSALLISSCAFFDDPSARRTVPEGAVDLGLSVFWAESNLGAPAPYRTGNYYAWGETEAKDVFEWNNYLWCDGSEEKITKYTTPTGNGLLNLTAADDAARVELSGKWRIPTDTEYAELRMNCNWIWTTQGGVRGYEVVSNINGKSIFIPALGYKEGLSSEGLGTECALWTASGCMSKPKYAFFTRLSASEILLDAMPRCNGLQIRPVSD